MASGAEKNKMFDQKRCFRARMNFTHLLMVADSALKLDYASVIFDDPGVQTDET